MASPKDIHQLRAQRDAALTKALAAEAGVRSIDAAIAVAQRAGNAGEVRELKELRTSTLTAAQSARATATRFRADALGNLSEWLDQSPEQLVATCSTDHPFVLLPVRLETKFARNDGSAELRVRIFPDDISIAAPPAPISAEETDAGKNYWRARVASRLAPADVNLRRAYEGTWATLATRFGAYRAGFIVSETTPQNPQAEPGDLEFVAPPALTEPPLPRADALPDRFMILTYDADQTTQALREINRVVGMPIPDDLALAPDASEPDSWLERDEATGRIAVPDALKWLVDFDAAVAVGMAVRIPLATPFDTNGFARVVAIGLRTATPAIEGPAALEHLLAKHRYGDGCGIVRAGTPTNNTDSAASGWQPASSETQQLFAIEDAPPDITPQEGELGVTDGWRLCDLLGLSSEFGRRLPNAAATDIAEALTMNLALTPGTLGNFVGDFLKDLVTSKTAASLHSFFVNWVSGRGLYPALRVGRQPYGLVVTSAWRNWKFSAPNPALSAQDDIAPAIYTLIDRHRGHWEMLARRAPHAGASAAEPFQRLLSIIGLLASSTEFVSRKAVSDAYIRQRLSFGGADAASIQQWFNALRDRRNQSLSASGFPDVTGPTDPLVAFMVFLDALDEWRLPVVDRDPAVPLSERERIGTYDGAHNYLNWLSEVTRADLASERFIGADGESVARPSALLYVLLRHALFAALEHDALAAAQQFGSAFFDVIDRDPLIANIHDQQHVLRKDYLEVDARRLGLSANSVALADWTLASARELSNAEPAAPLLAGVHAAIGALANLPTARLERLLAEHLDLCSYRLDAWITALYGQRLAERNPQERTNGLYLGAYGWVENLRPAGAERQRLSLEALPEPLRAGAGPNLFEETANGGYIHAPSLAQASTAAVLRNAYLSHASANQPLPFAVNLSSARMREALALTQGVRNGQPIAALLGYQFERGLHEGHPGIELDSFIGVLRDRFPLLSGRLTELPEGTKAEAVEARNVVDGLSLVEFTQGKTYPYSIDNLAAAGSAEALAIAAEVERARDALDAVSDLLLAESVHQATQGNFARTKAALQALTEPATPPEPEIIRTPRSGRVLTFRVALALDANATSGWTAALSPRALANPHLNHWLAAHMSAPGKIQWTVADGGAPASVESFAALGLEPIDLVLMSGDRLGDQSGELERYLIRRFRDDHAVPDERATVVAPLSGPVDPATSVVFDFGVAAAGGSPFASVHALLTRLRRMITRARATHAGDWRRSAESAHAEQSDPTGSSTSDPKLIAFKDLTDRLDSTTSGLIIASDALKAKLAALAPLQANLASDPATIADSAWLAGLEDLRQCLFALVAFGIPEALPADGLAVTAVLADRLTSQAQAVAKLADRRIAIAGDLRATSFTDPLPADAAAKIAEIARRTDVLRRNYIDAARALLGSAFAIVPLFRLQPSQTGELQQALAAPVVTDPHVVDEWIHSAARVHAPIADLIWAAAAARWNGQPMADPTVLQLPHQSSTSWIGGTFGADLPPAEWLSIVVLNAASVNNPLQAGLLIDDWTETVPTDKETTGLSFNFNRPNATAPQAVLIAVPPALTGRWALEDLVGSVHEALDLAHLRAVEPDALIGRNLTDTPPAGDYFQALPALLSEFSNSRFAAIDYADRVNAVFSALP